MYRYLALYLIFINIIAFGAYGIDVKRGSCAESVEDFRESASGTGCPGGRQHRSVVGMKVVYLIKQRKSKNFYCAGDFGCRSYCGIFGHCICKQVKIKL